ncbi:Uncharacterised protein [Mycoplasmopsis maculosa]|uniref:Uncharacterized protein n=1 Tax=Mycoplasmopsis maculosa TaxID=114885 RepID=A0A449B3R0_9BACT|nr:hypothetical protein [Mycoplasmopsis maculosa]VEU75220.1 Uncharacterised protein [Mycoplasmopsis maculosa]
MKKLDFQTNFNSNGLFLSPFYEISIKSENVRSDGVFGFLHNVINNNEKVYEKRKKYWVNFEKEIRKIWLSYDKDNQIEKLENILKNDYFNKVYHFQNISKSERIEWILSNDNIIIYVENGYIDFEAFWNTWFEVMPKIFNLSEKDKSIYQDKILGLFISRNKEFLKEIIKILKKDLIWFLESSNIKPKFDINLIIVKNPEIKKKLIYQID